MSKQSEKDWSISSVLGRLMQGDLRTVNYTVKMPFFKVVAVVGRCPKLNDKLLFNLLSMTVGDTLTCCVLGKNIPLLALVS